MPGMDVCQKKMREIIAKDKDATAVEQDMLTTLEVCYEFYLRGFTFHRMDLYLSDALHFRVDEEHKALIPPFISVAGLGKWRPCLWRSRLRDGGSSLWRRSPLPAPKVSKTHIDKLTEAGAFGDMPATSQLDLFAMLGARWNGLHRWMGSRLPDARFCVRIEADRVERSGS